MEQIALTNGGEMAQVQSVLLLTDGQANQWISNKEGIVAEMKKMQDQGLGAVARQLPNTQQQVRTLHAQHLNTETACTTS